MSIERKYDPAIVEEKWYKYWLEKGFFNSNPDDREPYTIVIPPPNVTGVLHMGHMLNNTIQDILIRRARLKGKNACWVPGTDHASIATEAKVVNKLAENGIHKKDIGREEFLKHAWEWKEKHDGIIFGQLKKLGASCDWRRARFTLDESLSDAVLQVFIQLHAEGKIYRGARMINWDPKAKTALSDEEVIRKEVNSRLYYIKYDIKDSDEQLIIATTRPETILGDTAICVHPEDERYTHLKGKFAVVPLSERIVPVIFDEYVDRSFGTGALKVTPAHDIHDYELGLKHRLEIIDTLNDDGTISEAAGFFIGEDRFTARKNMVKYLQENQRITKIEDILNNVGYSERNPDTVVEPRISTQWFLKMDELVKPAIKAIQEGEIKIHPAKFEKTYINWLENIKDWCISRQLWWGHRIPAWYTTGGNMVVAKNAGEAVILFQKAGVNVLENELRQDEDVLDTWFSSWLWPFSVFDWNKDKSNKDFSYYYPTNDLVTGHDIIFFWVARMIMAGYHFTGKKPFSNVYFTGMVRDKQGRKMSKQLGNSPDALELIKQFGADGVRAGMILSAPAGNDLYFDESLCLQGRNFANKIWNANRLLQGWKVDDALKTDNISKSAFIWFESRLNESAKALDQLYDQFRISEAFMLTYKLVWDDYCSWYLEMIKPAFNEPISGEVYQQAVTFFDKILVLLHPFLPFITEEIWTQLPGRNANTIMWQHWPEGNSPDSIIQRQMTCNQELISSIRLFRNDHNISFKVNLGLFITSKSDWNINSDLVSKMANVTFAQGNPDNVNGKSLLVQKAEFFIPLENALNADEEKIRIEKEIQYTLGFMKSVESKLQNQRFLANAPEDVVEIERKKFNDAKEKMEILKKQLQTI